MKLLIVTQKVDRDDPVLGFFHRWIEEFAKHCEKITVICLEKGEYNLPVNVKVLSLGKENHLYHSHAIRRFVSLWRFYKYIWQERKNYDAVFVHMNQEYVLLGGKLWLLLGKKIFMWRNHHAGNFLTDIASLFCCKVFCTSRYSYTAKYKKTVLMPVGVDTDLFKATNYKLKAIGSILFLGRITPSKNVDIFVEALGLLKKRGVDFTASIYGDALPGDAMYYEKLKSRASELALDGVLKFNTGIPNYKTPEVYNTHEVFINLSSSGMYDKTIFEAMACGGLTLASNDNLRGQIDNRLIVNERTAENVARSLANVMSLPEAEKKKMIEEEANFVERHSLQVLADKFFQDMSL